VLGDPEVLYGKLATGDAGRIAEVADSVDTAVTALDDGADALDGTLSVEGWAGAASAGYRDRVVETGVAVSGALRHMRRIVVVVRDAADSYARMRDIADRSIQTWRARRTDDDPELAARVMRVLSTAAVGYQRALLASLATLVDDADGGPTDGPLIPNTFRAGDTDGEWIPQGLAYDSRTDQLLVSYYSGHSDTDSLLSIIDENSGEEITNTRLAGVPVPHEGMNTPPNHSGGVAVDGDTVWVTSTEDDGGYVYRYSREDIEAAERGETVHATAKYPVGASSYATFADGKLWVGDFNEHGPGTLYSYDVNPDGRVADNPSSTHITPSKIQGVVIRDDEFVLSRSHGRNNPSSLLVQDRHNPAGFLYADSHGMPNMSEGIAEVDGDIVTLYESGAEEYADGDWPRDRATRTPLTDLLGTGYDVDPAALTTAAGKLDGAADSLAEAAATMSRTQLLATMLGTLPATAQFAPAVTAHIAAEGRNLTTGTQSVRDTADGLVSTATVYTALEDSALGMFTN
jgi:uncharacterized protein YukE